MTSSLTPTTRRWAMWCHLFPLGWVFLLVLLALSLSPAESVYWVTALLTPTFFPVLVSSLIWCKARSASIFIREHALGQLNFNASIALYLSAISVLLSQLPRIAKFLDDLCVSTGQCEPGLLAAFLLAPIFLAYLVGVVFFLALHAGKSLGAAIAAHQGHFYRFPLTIRFLRLPH